VKNVTVLSNMTRGEARAFLREHAGQRMCVSYACGTDGQIRFRPEPEPEPALVPVARLRPRPSSRAAGFVAALGVTAALAACAPHGEPSHREITGDMKIPSELVEAREPTTKKVDPPEPDPVPMAGAAVIPPEMMMDGEISVPGPEVLDEPCDKGKPAPQQRSTR
jgi:hypothetical protein